ncbi:hypothetical protein [Salinicoccus roseus]|uniref:hypothetical protein n=1 Tax=Salinicoccus roseus TaxID=45670 RepID=UPI001EF4EA5F|nr:hypothetical protein [Salinicoccus roseus]MCG7331207.1 hypothetical protein [Salinicoccus roseus]
MKSYGEIAREVQTTMPMLFDDIMEMGAHMESQIIEAEERQKGVSAMTEPILEELEEIKAHVTLIAGHEGTATHERIEKLRVLIEVTRTYNEK